MLVAAIFYYKALKLSVAMPFIGLVLLALAQNANSYNKSCGLLAVLHYLNTTVCNCGPTIGWIDLFKVVSMIGKNSVKLDLAHEYPELYPVL